ncbi:MAG: biopolymer transporter ExbD [Burkholderiaceae bacterium]|nr:biopolymer transporter ExbD [Burkholderiaceae bacterium]MBP6817085.1 biopolymer transporter ExbD [Burkholderiaceae bacterium]MBP7659827.1 biopolymer transporter ExbD [Burkholderiaceae bacterium]
MPSMQSRGRNGRQRRLVNEINVVPYIDVMLVLLVIFMVTAPLLPPGTIELPKVGASQKKPDVYIDARVDKTGKIVLVKIDTKEQSPVAATLDDVVAKAQALGASRTVPVVISGHRERPYGEIVDLLDRLQRQDIHAALMVKPGK